MPRGRLGQQTVISFSLGWPAVLQRILSIAAAAGLWLSADALAASAATHRSVNLIGIVTVIDGDTLELHGQRIRLHGIDAPESRQTCRRNDETWRWGQQAALALADHIERRTVSCEQRDVDRYKRIVAICRLGDEDLNAWMVRSGWAMAYRQYSKDYVADETVAKQSRRGIWAGEVQPPLGVAPQTKALSLSSVGRNRRMSPWFAITTQSIAERLFA